MEVEENLFGLLLVVEVEGAEMLGDEHLLGEVVGEVDVEVGELFGGVLAGVLEGLEFGLGLDGGE